MVRASAPLVLLLSGLLPASGAEVPGITAARERMVAEQIAARGVTDPQVLAAMQTVPRHRYVPSSMQALAYADQPLPIGLGQTISQPYIVALMTELARPRTTDRVLEVGTGSGYQAAVLAMLVEQVYSIEIVDALAQQAAATLRGLAVHNVIVRAGDGYAGWPEQAPFDIIMVTAAPDHIPAPLVEQLAPGGRLLVPVGPVADVQQLLLIEKDAAGGVTRREIAPVRFVPLTRPGRDQKPQATLP